VRAALTRLQPTCLRSRSGGEASPSRALSKFLIFRCEKAHHHEAPSSWSDPDENHPAQALVLLMLATVGCQALEQGVREENVDASEAAYDDGSAPDGPSN